jgi:hypothetical protein
VDPGASHHIIIIFATSAPAIQQLAAHAVFRYIVLFIGVPTSPNSPSCE